MTIARDWIEAAYARSSANAPGKTAQDPELLGAANRLYQALWALAAAAQPSAYQSRPSVTLSAGVGTLPAEVIDIRRIQTASGVRVTLAPVEELERQWQQPPVVFREGGTIVSRGRAGDPGPGDTLTLWVLDAPAGLTALTTPIDPRFPTRHHELVIVMLAMYLSAKDEGRDPNEWNELKSERDTHLEAFMRLSGLSMTALRTPSAQEIVQRFDAFLSGKGST